MNFFRNVANSIYNPEFYRRLLTQPFSFSLTYFYSIVLSLSFIITLVFSLSVLPEMSSLLSSLGPKIISYYPQDLVVTISQGEVSINQPEPYIIRMPDEFTRTGDLARWEHLVVIDTTDSFALDLSNPYNTYLLITKNDIVLFDETGGIRVESFTNVPDTVIDRAYLAALMRQIEPYIAFAIPLIVVGIFLALIVVGSMILIYLLLGGLFIWALTKLKGMSIGYKKSYQLGLHAITLPALINILIALIIPMWYIHFLFTVLMLLVVAMNVQPALKRK